MKKKQANVEQSGIHTTIVYSHTMFKILVVLLAINYYKKERKKEVVWMEILHVLHIKKTKRSLLDNIGTHVISPFS